ncbi:MAG TPA: cyclic nucleotide-binding domain-containing protein [Gammaproteobacteria bacterium]|nr:cyclic nucleotide-binding domain-containing protein [Gammaproteobacteria bacterium]
MQPVCLPWEMEVEERKLLDRIVEHPRPLQKGEYLYRAGDPLLGIYAVRSGLFKNHQPDGSARDRVVGFGLPGELLGVDGIYSQRHGSAAVALMESAVCVLPYTELAALLGRSERLRDQILRLASRGAGPVIGAAARNGSSEWRVAAFLLDLALRNHAHGGSRSRFAFPIPEQDVANHLQLAPQEAERIFAYFQGNGLIARDKNDLCVLDEKRLGRIAGAD